MSVSQVSTKHNLRVSHDFSPFAKSRVITIRIDSANSRPSKEALVFRQHYCAYIHFPQKEKQHFHPLHSLHSSPSLILNRKFYLFSHQKGGSTNASTDFKDANKKANVNGNITFYFF